LATFSDCVPKPSTLSTIARSLRSLSSDSGIMSSVNWWISTSFCGSFSRLVSLFSQSVVTLTSCAVTLPIT
jgi:hypothetical protein